MSYENLVRHHSSIKAKKPIEVVGKCPKCGNDLIIRKGRSVKFTACSNYPECKFVLQDESLQIDEKCPECEGELLVKLTRKGKKYIGCENYPKCSYARWCESEVVNNENHYSDKFKKGQRSDVNEEVRSSWEANIIRLFNYLNIEYKYESDGYNLDVNNSNYDYASPYYIPDFILNDGTIIEVKGHLEYRSLQNMKRFKELYPEENIIVIDSDVYYLLAKKYSEKIASWEGAYQIMMQDIDVVGITLKERVKYVNDLENNEELFIIREKDNKFDANAIKVVDKDNHHIGYIASEYANYLAPKVDAGIKYQLKIKEKKDKVLKCTIKATNLADYDISNYINIF